MTHKVKNQSVIVCPLGPLLLTESRMCMHSKGIFKAYSWVILNHRGLNLASQNLMEILNV